MVHPKKVKVLKPKAKTDSGKSSKTPAPAPDVAKNASGAEPEQKSRRKSNPLYEKRTKKFGINQEIQLKRDVTAYVKWPKYIRLQRQKAVLLQRLRVPPPINQFKETIGRDVVRPLFRLMDKYKPETRQAKRKRLAQRAEAKKDGKADKPTHRPAMVRSGLNTITKLIEQKKAQLVVLAHDVEPIELVVWMPALCRKMGVPYMIVKGKSRLGQVVHRKTATCLALDKVRPEDKTALANLAESAVENYNNRADQIRRNWGASELSAKSKDAKVKAEAAKRAAMGIHE